MLFPLLLGCGTAATGGLGAAQQPIVGGSPASGDEAAVALIARRVDCEAEPILLCSGAAIAERAVLTAAHCLDVLGVDGQYEVFFGEALLPRPAGRFVRVDRAFVHPAYDPETHAFDAALLILAAPAEVQPLPLPPEGATIDVGAEARAIGFGESRGAAPAGRRLQGTTVVTAVEAAAFHAGPGPAMSCTGDSGGPVLLEGPDGEWLAGITVSGDFACRERAVAVRVDALADFLAPLLAASDEVAPAETPHATIPVADLCAEPCGSDADCPHGLACVGPREDGPGRCMLHQLQEGTFGAICENDATCGPGGRCARLESEGEGACRCFTPCEAAKVPGDGGGGCSAAPGPLLPWLPVAWLAGRRLRQRFAWS